MNITITQLAQLTDNGIVFLHMVDEARSMQGYICKHRDALVKAKIIAISYSVTMHTRKIPLAKDIRCRVNKDLSKDSWLRQVRSDVWSTKYPMSFAVVGCILQEYDKMQA